MKMLTIPAFAERRPHEHLGRAFTNYNRRASAYCNLHVLCRAVIEIAEDTQATLRITADDCYKLYVDGVFQGIGPAPGFAFDYFYNTYELTLTKGRHVLAAHIYYQGEINRVWNSGDDRFGLAAELTAGDAELPLDWKYCINHARHGNWVGYMTQYMENFDSSFWNENWNILTFDDSGWDRLVPALYSDHVMREQPSKMLAVYEKRPVLVEKRAPGKIFVDMGQEITGSLRLKAKGAKGKLLTVYSAEELNDDGSVRWEMRCKCNYKETWKLAGSGEECWEPYEYKGFRYAEIVTDEDVELTDICAVVRHYPADDSVCTFSTSDPWLGKIFELCRETVRYGIQDGYLDCPTREKGQYLGDAIVTSRAQMILTDGTELVHKALEQFAETDPFCPALLGVSPGAFMQEIADSSLFWGNMALYTYYHDGDQEKLASYYPVAKRIVEHYEQYLGDNGLLWSANDKWNLVDWPDNLRDNYDFVLTQPPRTLGCHNAINAQFIGAVQTLERMEEILGIDAPKRYEQYREAFNRAFYREETGLYVDSVVSEHSSLHAQLFALYFGLQKDEALPRTVEFIREKGLSCGVYTTHFLLQGLGRIGAYDLVYELLVNETEHGWVNMLREGATTCFEAWGKDQKWNTSFLHPFACSPTAVITEVLCGICADATVPAGYRVEPHIPDVIEELHMSRRICGKTVSVHKQDGRVWWEET